MISVGKRGILTLSLAVFAIGAFMLMGCGAQQSAPPDTKPADEKAATEKAPETPAAPAEAKAAEPAEAKPAEAPAAEAAPATPAAAAAPAPGPMGDIVPKTIDVLRLMPDQSMVALAVPSIDDLIAKAVKFAKRVVPEGIDIDTILADSVAGMAEDIGVAEAKTFADIARAKGLDLAGPVAVFLDLNPMRVKLDEALAYLKEQEAADLKVAQEAADKAHEEAVKKAKKEGRPAPPPPIVKVPTPDAQVLFERSEKVNALLAEMAFPGVVGVLTCTDPAAAEATIKDVLNSEGSPLAGLEVKDVDAEGVTMHVFGDNKFAYFVSGNMIIGGNNADFVKATAARIKNPAPIRYGTVDCPATSTDEVVELIRMDNLMPFVEVLMPVLSAVDPSSAALIKAAASLVQGMSGAYTSPDPVVATLLWDDEKIEFQTRVDFNAQPGVKTMTGEASAMKLATLVPETAQVLLSLRFNKELKANIQSQGLGMIPPDLLPQQAAVMLPQMVTMIGDELTVAFMGMQEAVPNILLMLNMSDVETTKGLLQVLVPMAISENYSGVDIMSVQMELPLKLYVVFVKDMVLIGTDVASLKSVIDSSLKGETSPLFASLDPPLDPAAPRYSMFLLKTDKLAELVPQIGSLVGGIPPEAMMVVNALTSLVREVRMTQEMVNNWQVSTFAIRFHPEGYVPPAPAPAAPAEAAPAAPAEAAPAAPAEAAPAAPAEAAPAAPAEAAPAPAAQQ